jgi:hypothetical protein
MGHWSETCFSVARWCLLGEPQDAWCFRDRAPKLQWPTTPPTDPEERRPFPKPTVSAPWLSITFHQAPEPWSGSD